MPKRRNLTSHRPHDGGPLIADPSATPSSTPNNPTTPPPSPPTRRGLSPRTATPAEQPVQTMPCPEQFLDDRQLAARWKCSPKTLRNQRSRGEGCPFVRLGRLVRYRLSNVMLYEATHAELGAEAREAGR